MGGGLSGEHRIVAELLTRPVRPQPFRRLSAKCYQPLEISRPKTLPPLGIASTVRIRRPEDGLHSRGRTTMFKYKRTAAVTAAAVAAALALAGCSSGGSGGSGGSSSGTGSSGGTLNLGLIVAASTFAAKDMRWANESPYAQAVYDSLLKAD